MQTDYRLLEVANEQSNFEELLCTPSPSFQTDTSQVTRLAASYVNKGARFILQKKLFANQYSKSYTTRYTALRPRVLQEAKRLWPDQEVCRILELREQQQAVLVGIVYKDMKLKPTILDEYTKDKSVQQLTARTRFSSEDDSLVLEDDGARIALAGSRVPVTEFVTGMIIGVKGMAQGEQFVVDDWCFAAMGDQPPRPIIEQDKYVAFVCGLNLGDQDGTPLKLSIMLDYLGGLLGGGPEHNLVSKIVRVVVAGGLLSSSIQLYSTALMAGAKQQHAAVEPIRELDMCLCQLASLAAVDVMPGESDPASHSLPQQPLHPCLFPAAARFDSFSSVTNPHEFEVDGVTFLGTSGQNIDDINRYSTHDERMAMLECSMRWCHITPTAPDTLTCYPFEDNDPFVVDTPPHVYFVGNQPSFGVHQMTGPKGQSIQLVCLPAFSSTGTIVLLNLRSLHCHPLHFELPSL